jgi:hypothetical protein
MMKKTKISQTVLLLLCMGITALHAQQSANAAGGDAQGSGGSASFSLGQPTYTYISATGNSSNQGVQQPYEFFTVGIDEPKDISLLMSVFPNPAQVMVNLKIESPGFENLSYQLFDMNGRLLLTQKISNPLTEVPMQTLAVGPYLLRVVDAQKELKTFKIIKNN